MIGRLHAVLIWGVEAPHTQTHTWMCSSGSNQTNRWNISQQPQSSPVLHTWLQTSPLLSTFSPFMHFPSMSRFYKLTRRSVWVCMEWEWCPAPYCVVILPCRVGGCRETPCYAVFFHSCHPNCNPPTSLLFITSVIINHNHKHKTNVISLYVIEFVGGGGFLNFKKL